MKKTAIEIVSDIGSRGFDLQFHSDQQIAEAVRVLRTVNGPMFDWLVRVLSQDARTEALVHGRTCRKAPHSGPGMMHGADDDRPYDVDGVNYCGRCHEFLASSRAGDAPEKALGSSGSPQSLRNDTEAL